VEEGSPVVAAAGLSCFQDGSGGDIQGGFAGLEKGGNKTGSTGLKMISAVIRFFGFFRFICCRELG